MEEENREQPTFLQANVSSETSEECALANVGSQEISARQAQVQPEQENFGKFKSAEDLLQAYNNLEAEFTKKCQRLSMLEKDKTEENLNEVDFDEEFSKFLSRHEEAREFSAEIKESVQGGDLRAGGDAFENAWAKLVLQHLSNVNKKAEDPIIKRYVLSSEEVKNRIVENYLNALKEQKAPMILSSQKGERVSSLKPDTPKTLKEAKSLVEKMFS